MYICKIQLDRKAMKFTDGLLSNQNYGCYVLQALSGANLNVKSKK